MKKQLKVLFIALLTLFVVLSTTGCGNGANILTDVTLLDDFSGKRVMETSISKSAFNEFFSGTLDDLKGLLGETCPSDLLWDVEESDSNYICTFTLEFDSIDTYKDKVASIIGEDREIEVLKADSVFAQGISYHENFSSIELLEWFTDALVESGYVDSSNKSDIFESDSTSFEFDKKEYQTSTFISVSDLNYLDNGVIDILTKPNYDGSFDRSVIFHIPSSTLSQKQDEITSFLEGGVPKTATMSWEEDSDNNESLFKIEVKNATVDELDSAMKSIFHTENASVLALSYPEELNMLDKGISFKETLDVSQFVSDSYLGANVRYFISNDVTSNVLQVYEDDSEGPIYAHKNENIYSGYTSYMDDYISLFNLRVDSKISYLPDEINVTTRVKGLDKIERDIEFIYQEALKEEDKSSLEQQITDVASEHADLTFGMKDDKYVITFSQVGLEEELAAGFDTIFNDTSSSIYYARESSKTAFSIDSAFEESISFNGILSNVNKYVPVNYSLELTSGEKIHEDSLLNYQSDNSIESVTSDGNSLTLVSRKLSLDITVTASKFNFVAIIWWLLRLIFVLSLGLAAYMGYLKFKGSKNQLSNKLECPICKVTFDDDIKFCTKCGSVLEEQDIEETSNINEVIKPDEEIQGEGN